MQAALPTPLPIPINMGGTGAVTAALARANLGIDGGIYKKVATEAELIAALLANEPLIYVTTSITATQDYLVTDDCEVRLGTGVLLDMGGSYGFVAGAGLYFDLTGNGVEQSRINWNTSGVAHDLVQLDAGAQCRLKELAIVESNTSANAGQIHTAARKLDCYQVKFVFANDNVRRFALTFLTSVRNEFQSVEFSGGGSSCSGKVAISDTNAVLIFNNTYITGTWQSIGGFFSITANSKSAIVGFYIPAAQPQPNLAARLIDNVWALSSNVAITAEIASNIYCSGLYPNTKVLTDFVCASLLFNGGLGGQNYISKGIINSAFSTNSYDGTNWEGVTFLAGATIQNGADDHSFMGCIFGNYGTAGAQTLTIQAGANRTIAVGCKSDAAISDAGTGSQLAANTVF
jgi:hypothetical protein